MQLMDCCIVALMELYCYWKGGRDMYCIVTGGVGVTGGGGAVL